MDLSQPVLAENLWTGEPVEVHLANLDQACAVLGICRQGAGGSTIIDGETGFTCIANGLSTSDWQTVYTPNGDSSIVCKFGFH